jgi:hypothetical protein
MIGVFKNSILLKENKTRRHYEVQLLNVFKQIISVQSESYTKLIKTLCVQNILLLNFESGSSC